MWNACFIVEGSELNELQLVENITKFAGKTRLPENLSRLPGNLSKISGISIQGFQMDAKINFKLSRHENLEINEESGCKFKTSNYK